MKIPFVDLYAQYLTIKEEMDEAIERTIRNTSFIGGPDVPAFEKEFAAYIGQSYAVACANGTDSLEILLQAFGVGTGDEVIVPAHSWISTAECVSMMGATPVFVDTHPDTYTMDPTKIEEKITDKTKVIIPVHLFGLPADMDPIMALAEKYNLKVIEDSAQSHGATYNGRKIGTIGHAASFSFYPGKNLGAYGDAGGIVTADEALATKFRMIARHGQLKKHDHKFPGRNSRLDGLQAAILRVKLPYLPKWTALRQQHAAAYTERLKDVPGIKIPHVPEGSTHVHHLYVVQVSGRDEIQANLKEKGIATSIHYPTPLPLLEAYDEMGYTAGDIPSCAAYTPKLLSLPIYPEMTVDMIDYVCEHLIQNVNVSV
ncbi:MAG: DegT/DnrJ/EryC1/StrS family aminotransferase [Bacteroidota bacterium]